MNLARMQTRGKGSTIPKIVKKSFKYGLLRNVTYLHYPLLVLDEL